MIDFWSEINTEMKTSLLTQNLHLENHVIAGGYCLNPTSPSKYCQRADILLKSMFNRELWPQFVDKEALIKGIQVNSENSEWCQHSP